MNKGLEDFYDRVYKKGEEKHFTTLKAGKRTEEIDEVLKELDWKSKSVLDVGCGTGFFSYNVSKKCKNVLGIDFSKEAINIACEKYKNNNLRYKQMDVNNIKEKYDVIVCIGTLEHVDNPLNTIRLFKKHLNPKGSIIITSPNWTNVRGYILMTLLHLFNSPITLADLHYLTPIDFMDYSKKLNMNMEWRTIDKSWAHGDILIHDFQNRLSNVLRDSKLPNNPNNIKNLINWIEKNVLPFDNDLIQSGAIGLYKFT